MNEPKHNFEPDAEFILIELIRKPTTTEETRKLLKILNLKNFIPRCIKSRIKCY